MAEHLVVNDDGNVIGRTLLGEELIEMLRLNLQWRNERRLDHLLIEAAAAADPDNPRVQAIRKRQRSYPSNMPDLKIYEPPGGNAKPEGLNASHTARQRNGELSDIY
ncbi:hypothetical protein R5W23_003388 [Gemmata sp. JC673]|uniref:Uncharacterized protein n=1 Tax=Gemmata algarum TaxID=2975278 RepID=A0ABU5F6M4_9BACT|nr:hypothetical protein [Gemmata algarum]MDY3561958.1 hypothetical protein [Gemmata algarum]